MTEVKYQFPEKLGFLFKPSRYKVAYGGRDGAKSWSFARALLLLGAEKPMRILCAREVQNSIKDSVYKLLCDQIQDLGLGQFYDCLAQEIRGKNGTEIVFSGLSKQTRESIKSFEGVDVCWVEEAHVVSKISWGILIPTIRKDGSEIWVSFNPELDTDDTYQRFIVNQPSDATVVNINWNDNPWRSKALDSDREDMQRTDPDEYAHIYGGACRAAVQGAIYFKEVSALRSSGRFGIVNYDPMLKAHVVVDLGFNDYMSILVTQRLGSEIRVIRYIEDRLRDIPSYDAELKALGLNWGKAYLPHDARARTVTSASNPLGATAQEQFERLGWTVEIVENIEIEQGIRKTREVFPRVHVSKDNASELINRLGRYRRRVNAEGQASTPVHDDASHGSDGFRYLCLVADQLSNDAGPAPTGFYRAFQRAA